MRSLLRHLALKALRPLVPKGSVPWLIMSELQYGGYIENVPRNKVSAKDPRSAEEIRRGGMIGGDRMNPSKHGYAKYYAKYLKPVIAKKKRIVCMEIGILRGTGLAIWSDLFPDGSIIGLDIDLSHTRENMPSLMAAGAFANNNVELYEFDQFTCSCDSVGRLLNGRQIDVFIDDGIHTDDAIINTFRAVAPYLSTSAVYLVEDNATVSEQLRSLSQPLNMESLGELTVLTGPEFRLL
jgi:hypothetical protein